MRWLFRKAKHHNNKQTATCQPSPKTRGNMRIGQSKYNDNLYPPVLIQNRARISYEKKILTSIPELGSIRKTSKLNATTTRKISEHE